MINQVLKFIALFSLLLLFGCNTTGPASDNPEMNKPKIAAINLQLGMAYIERKDMQRAKQKFLLAMEQAPELPEVWYSMGYFMENTGSVSEANDYYLKAVILAPKRGDVQNNYGTYLCRKGQYRTSIQHFILATKDPEYLDTASAYENAGLCALKIPDKDAAKHYFQISLAQDPLRSVPISELKKLK